MTKKRAISFFLLFVFFTYGFLNFNSSYKLRLVPPHSHSPLQGTWVISDSLQDNTAVSEQWLGKKLLFSDEYVLLGSYLLPHPRFQIKRTDVSGYFDTRQAFYQDLFARKKEVEVLTLADQHLFLCELLPLNEEELILQLFNNSYLLRKISDHVDKSLLNSPEVTEISNITGPQQANLQSGVLLGLRSPDNRYRTLWLAAEDRHLAPLLQTDTIVFPRRNGFYKLEVVPVSLEEQVEDFLLVTALSGRHTSAAPELTLDPAVWEGKTGSIRRHITYVGNDFVSLEESIAQAAADGSTNQASRLLTVSVDSLPAIRAVKISDLIRAEPTINLQQQAEQLQTDRLTEENFSLARHKGYWQLVSRPPNQSDVPLGIIPPSHLLFYNELALPWPRIKNHVPQASDVLTSPNEDLALVFTGSEIIVYAMFHHSMAVTPLLKIPLREGEKMIMAEWALGHYVENWTLTFQSLL